MSTIESKPPARKRARKEKASASSAIPAKTAVVAVSNKLSDESEVVVLATTTATVVPSAGAGATAVTVDVPLTFDFSAARDHLRRADERFGPLFEQLPCKPFEKLQDGGGLEHVNPFGDLASSILGQQVIHFPVANLKLIPAKNVVFFRLNH
jgi:DNA-3-methyladenine glycosylase II